MCGVGGCPLRFPRIAVACRRIFGFSAVERENPAQLVNVFADAFAASLVMTDGWKCDVGRTSSVVPRSRAFWVLEIPALVVFWLLPKMLGSGVKASGVPIATSIICSGIAILVAGLDFIVQFKAGSPRRRAFGAVSCGCAWACLSRLDHPLSLGSRTCRPPSEDRPCCAGFRTFGGHGFWVSPGRSVRL